MKKGFTLIELLAVILILGIIAMIAVPQVTNTIEKSKKGAAETSAKHYIDAVTNAIGLNQLDEDDSNDINDGTHNVSDLTVDISGEAPSSGTVVIEEGSVKSASFVINGYNVVCTGKGKCTASKGSTGDYVYYQTKGQFTSLDQTVPTRPTEYPAYLKINKNDITQIQTCIYDNGAELCLNPNEYETSKQKIQNYFGYDASTWTQLPSDENKWLKTPGDETVGCDIHDSALSCFDSVAGARAHMVNSDYVYAFDMSAEFECGVFPDGYAGCD